ncbi:MAG: hypothetical protein EOR86_17730 [Mesorhizobium sp.]|uniref:hypothetical protein n=1 Tax=Mesorhizobium sp. TaxID=1871066 RepID=UPI000FE9B642|nr:hypothetical protein [Mesorhizobium sp.]RWM94029.1 MAG: hypothetical protein EOR86_17730 [Mesorhizobium sp.]
MEGRVTKRRRDDEVRAEALQIFDEKQREGLTAKEASKAAGFPLASIYRWKRNPTLWDQYVPNPEASMSRIDHAIETLVENAASRASKLHAILEIGAWLVWPGEIIGRPLASMALLLIYYARTRRVGNLGELSRDELQWLLPLIAPSEFEVMFKLDVSFLPHFKEYPIYEQPFTERDVAANIGKYFIEADGSVLAERPSIERAHRALNNGGFRHIWPLTNKPFRRFFRTRAPTMPMLYVEQFQSSFDLHFDPEDESFVENVDSVLSQPSELLEFLAKCRWATRQMQSKLDRRALAHIRFPKFPEWLREEACEIRPLEPEVLDAVTEPAFDWFDN